MCFSFQRKLVFVLSIITLGFYGVESYASGNQAKHVHNKVKHAKSKKGSRKTLAQGSKKSIVSALEANEVLHSGFFKYNAKSVEKSAKKLNHAIGEIKDKEVAKLLKFSRGKLAEIKASNDRETNNKHYHLVSMALIHIVNTYDVGQKYNAYSCPMVKKKWIQNSAKQAKVHNPYAPEMPHCGTQDSHH